ncbi:DUF2332 family protein [Kitasatospora sp. NPDC097643]|uniref:DUF2332 family protein n=1 Tax=Kitasatospora sp. NPDC097643 TaxID=3157230 RepID=UPI003325AB14
MLARRTQKTNEAGRWATLLPLLASLPQPLALIEVRASAGLCLYSDRYRYRRASEVVGPMPEVVWRAGTDLNPVDVRAEDDMRWLEALVWPEQTRPAEPPARRRPGRPGRAAGAGARQSSGTRRGRAVRARPGRTTGDRQRAARTVLGLFGE